MPAEEGFRVSFERERLPAFGRDVGGRILAAPVVDIEDVITEIDVGEEQIAAMIAERIGAVTEFFPAVPELLPASLRGRLVAPNGSPAAGAAVEALPPPGRPAAPLAAPPGEGPLHDPHSGLGTSERRGGRRM